VSGVGTEVSGAIGDATDGPLDDAPSPDIHPRYLSTFIEISSSVAAGGEKITMPSLTRENMLVIFKAATSMGATPSIPSLIIGERGLCM
jgi:hypothetical protein